MTSSPRLAGLVGRAAAPTLASLALLTGCSAGSASRADLQPVVERDGVPFAGRAIPERVLDRLAANRVILLGETHHLREHWAFVAALLRDLHGRGVRQLLVERPEMEDWLLEDYLNGGPLEPDWVFPAFWVNRFRAIRDLNATLPSSERIRVRAIDVNEDAYGGAFTFRSLLGAFATHLPSAGPVEAFMGADYSTGESQLEAIEALRASLDTERRTLVASWGADAYDRVVEMVDVERASIDIRSLRQRDDNRAARAREDVIKRLADARIAGYPQRTVINIGGNHAQKARLKGTKQEWLGDYLVHRSAAVEGTVVVLAVVSAKTELEPGAGGTPFDVLDKSPANELFRLTAERWPGQTVFLPLDDPIFSDGRVAVNFEETIYDARLREHYDAVLQYGLAHRMPA